MKTQKDNCMSKQGQRNGLLEASLLLLLKGKAKSGSHGYQLMQDLAKLGFADGSFNISAIYRNLRSMERSNLIESGWTASEQGPSKRVYKITQKGQEELQFRVTQLESRKKQIEIIISKYEGLL